MAVEIEMKAKTIIAHEAEQAAQRLDTGGDPFRAFL